MRGGPLESGTARNHNPAETFAENRPRQTPAKLPPRLRQVSAEPRPHQWPILAGSRAARATWARNRAKRRFRLQIQASSANASATPRINPILAGTPLAAAGALMVVRRRKGDLVANAFEHKGPGHVCFAKKITAKATNQ